MSEPRKINCLKCKHFNQFGGGCKAFEDIPDEIVNGLNKHEKPIKGQKGTFVFEPIEP